MGVVVESSLMHRVWVLDYHWPHPSLVMDKTNFRNT